MGLDAQEVSPVHLDREPPGDLEGSSGAGQVSSHQQDVSTHKCYTRTSLDN